MIKRIVADASVFIFVGKIRRLALLGQLWDGPFYISDLVKREILPPSLDNEEREYLTQELRLFKTVSPRLPSKTAGALSRSDWSVVHLGQQVHADIILADEKLLRNVLVGMGFTVLGTLGVLMAAAEKKLISKNTAKDYVDTLITHDRFHIGAQTYQLFLKILAPR